MNRIEVGPVEVGFLYALLIDHPNRHVVERLFKRLETLTASYYARRT